MTGVEMLACLARMDRFNPPAANRIRFAGISAQHWAASENPGRANAKAAALVACELQFIVECRANARRLFQKNHL